jgi:hypothetical protein
MGNISESCSCKKGANINFSSCENLNSVGDQLSVEINKVNKKAQALGNQNSLPSHQDYAFSGNFENYSFAKAEEMRQFFFYLKLEIILLKVKTLIEESTLRENIFQKIQEKTIKEEIEDINPSFFSKTSSSDFKMPFIKKYSNGDIRTPDPFITEENKDDTNEDGLKTPKTPLNLKYIRRSKKSNTTKASVTIHKTIDLGECIYLLNEIFNTEETQDEEQLNKIETSLELRLFNLRLGK